MNFLAHAYLSGNDEGILVGNFIGDFVKGRKFNNYDNKIITGIKLHREIDRYTDSHEIVHKSKSLLTTKYRHYSAVIVDIFYDHFLAANWKDYHRTDLLTFTLDVYEVLQNHDDILPPRVKKMLGYMISGNWLYNYSHIEGINNVLGGMARRTKFESGMENASDDLELYYEEFKSDFQAFFPDLINFAASFEIDRE